MLLTPSQLSTQPNIMSIMVPDYDFDGQSREMLMAGSYTAGSIQTFSNNGQPCDNQSDKND
jgi:hypothetical protein